MTAQPLPSTRLAPSRAPIAPPAAPPPLDSVRLLRTPRHHRVFFRWVLGLALLAFAVLFLPWQQSVEGRGTVTALRPGDRPQVVPSQIGGRIEQWLVAEGQYVTRGTPLVQLQEVKDAYLDPRTLERYGEQLDAKAMAIAAKEDKVRALDRQVAALERGLVLSLDQGRNKVEQYRAGVAAAEIDSSIAVAQLARRELLVRDGLSSLTELESARAKRQQADAKLVEKRQELRNAEIELQALEAEYADKIAKARADRSATAAEVSEGRGDLAKSRNDRDNLAIRTSLYRVVAPQDGIVVRALRAGVGEQVKEGEALVTIQPAHAQQAVELYVKAMDVPLLRPGRKVRLQFDGWPALQFSGWPSVSVGTFGGEIRVIDFVSSADGTYRVLVTPDPADEPWPPQLRMGSGVIGWTLLDEVKVWFEVWRRLNGFPPSIRSSDTESPGSAAKAK